MLIDFYGIIYFFRCRQKKMNYFPFISFVFAILFTFWIIYFCLFIGRYRPGAFPSARMQFARELASAVQPTLT